MSEPSVKDPQVKSFKQNRGVLEKIVSKNWKNPINRRAALFLSFSKLYHAIAENTQDESVKDCAKTEAEYFFKKYSRCEAEYLMQREDTLDL